MRNYFLVWVLMLFSVSITAQEKLPDSVITKAFRFLKNGDEAGYLSLFPNRHQHEKILLSLSNSPEHDSIISESLRNQSEEEYNNSMQPFYLSIFRQVIKTGEERGINWSRVKLNRFEIDSKFLKFRKNHRNGIIYFSDSTEYYKLRFNEVSLSPEDGWVGIVFSHLSGKDWDKEIEPFEEFIGDSTVIIEDDIEVRDVIMTNVSEREPPPPPPPPAKPKKKIVVKEVPKNPKKKS